MSGLWECRVLLCHFCRVALSFSSSLFQKEATSLLVACGFRFLPCKSSCFSLSLHSWTHPYLYKRKTTMPYEKFKFRIQSHQDYSWCFRNHTCGELCWIIERLDWQRFCSVWVSTSRWGHRHHLHHRLDPFSGSKLVSHFYMTVYVLQCSYMLLAWKL